MNNTQLVNKMISEGKAKFGLCDNKNCSENTLLYKVKYDFICGNCLDDISNKMSSFGRIVR